MTKGKMPNVSQIPAGLDRGRGHILQTLRGRIRHAGDGFAVLQGRYAHTGPQKKERRRAERTADEFLFYQISGGTACFSAGFGENRIRPRDGPEARKWHERSGFFVSEVL